MNETRRAILSTLEAGPVSGPTLAAAHGLTRAAVWKHVEALREAGFEIESGPAGYSVATVPEFGAEAIQYGLEAPFTVEYHESIESTNDRARELAVDGAADVVVLADEQPGGRGRLDREWIGPSGGIYLSIVCRPTLPPAAVPTLTLAAAVATASAVQSVGIQAGIKWPNDVLTGGAEAKLAGVLTEMEGEHDRVSWVVVGIGINANVEPDALPPGATSLLAELGSPVDRRTVVQRLLEAFDALREAPDATLDAWREHALTLGRRVRIETMDGPVVGQAVDVVSPGALVVDTGTERVRVHAGDCVHLRPD